MVSIEGTRNKLKEIKRKHPVMKKPAVTSKDYYEYMTQKLILQNAKYYFLKEAYPAMDKFFLINE